MSGSRRFRWARRRGEATCGRPSVTGAGSRPNVAGRTPERGAGAGVAVVGSAGGAVASGGADTITFEAGPFPATIPLGAALPALSGTGDALYRSKQYLKAVEKYQTIAEKYPQAEEYNNARLMVPYLHEQAGDTATALTLYRQVLKEHPNHPDTTWLQKRIVKLTTPVKSSDK